MNFEHFKTISTEWSIIDYYKIPSQLQFSVTWVYGGGWIDTVKETQVTQNARSVSVTRRKSDNTVFDCQVLDEEGITIRGKHCRNIKQYTNICNYFI